MMVLILENYFILDTLILMGSLAHKNKSLLLIAKIIYMLIPLIC